MRSVAPAFVVVLALLSQPVLAQSATGRVELTIAPTSISLEAGQTKQVKLDIKANINCQQGLPPRNPRVSLHEREYKEDEALIWSADPNEVVLTLSQTASDLYEYVGTSYVNVTSRDPPKDDYDHDVTFDIIGGGGLGDCQPLGSSWQFSPDPGALKIHIRGDPAWWEQQQSQASEAAAPSPDDPPLEQVNFQQGPIRGESHVPGQAYFTGIAVAVFGGIALFQLLRRKPLE